MQGFVSKRVEEDIDTIRKLFGYRKPKPAESQIKSNVKNSTVTQEKNDTAKVAKKEQQRKADNATKLVDKKETISEASSGNVTKPDGWFQRAKKFVINKYEQRRNKTEEE